MKLFEDYLILRNHFSKDIEGQEIKVSSEQLSSILFCTTRNVKIVLNKLINKNWISYRSGVGRGNRSTLVFYYSTFELLKFVIGEMVSKGNLEKVLYLIKTYGDHSIKEYFQSFISNYFGFSSETQNHEVFETLRLPIFRSLNTLVPFESYYSLDVHIIKQVYNTLVRFDDKSNEVIPSIAHYWESNDKGTDWTFYLRKMVFFHDGKELTADAVKSSLDHLNTYWLGEDIHSIQIINRYCLNIRLKRPNRMFPVLLSYPQASIVPDNLYNDRQPVGTGPYKVTKFTSGVCVLEAFSHHFEHNAFIDRIEIYDLSLLHDEGLLTKRESDLLIVDTGEYEINNIPKWDQKREICGTTILTINQGGSAFLKDFYFRKALHHLINRAKMVAELGKLRVYPSNSFQIATNLSKSDEEHDFEKGLEMLQRSRYQGELIKLFTYPRHEEDANWIKEHLSMYGINIEVTIQQWAEMSNQAKIHEADMILLEHVISEGMQRLIEAYRSDKSFIKCHLDMERSEYISSIFQEAFACTSSPQTLYPTLNRLEKLLVDDHSIIFLNYKLFSTYHHSSLHYFSSKFDSWVDFKQIWIKK